MPPSQPAPSPQAMAEVPKRLPPSRETLRELYLKSGNRCAFSGCERALFNAKGVFVAQVCHIEAAEPGGERFNKDQTNEQRRQAANLMLMCYDHHVETNDVDKFSVERMTRMKLDHERVFSDVVGAIQKTVTDHTTLVDPVFPKNMRRLSKTLGWNHSDSELSESLAELLPVLQRFARLPLPTRQFFKILVTRGHDARLGADLEVSAVEVQQATNVSDEEARGFFSILDRHGFTVDADVDDFGMPQVGVAKLRSGWPIWSDLRTFCEKEHYELSLLCENLDFGRLDEA